MFHSADGGDHWRHVPLDPLNAKGQIYCRDIREVPGNPRKLWVAAGGSFQSEVGVLLHSPRWRGQLGPGRDGFATGAHDVRPGL